MATFGLFLIKSIVVSGLLTAWYLLGLRGRRLHQYNRFFLLSALFVSLVIPFFHFQLFTIPHAVTGGLAPVLPGTQPGTNTGGGTQAIQAAQSHIDWQAIAGAMVAGISLLLLAVLCARIYRVLMMARQCTVTQQAGISLVFTESPRAPFTFLNYLFWNNATPLDGEIGQLIFRHELTHIEQGHTYDKLVCQLLTCVFWFNPFYWIIQKELNAVHEFIADEQAVGGGDTETFAMMLLQSYNNGSYLVPEHHFFSSTVKRRLMMLQNAVQPSYAPLRRFMVVPLIIGTVLLLSFGVRNEVAGHITPAAKRIVVLVDAGHGGGDAGERSGSYNEKDISLKYARRIQELSQAYNVDVKLTRKDDRDMQLADRVAVTEKVKPDVLISLHVGDKPGKEKAKGDFEVYVSGSNAHAAKSSNYSSAILDAMAQDGIIPGIAKKCGHTNTRCNCGGYAAQTSVNGADANQLSATNEGGDVVDRAHVPGMVMVLGNIKNKEGMQQLTDDVRVDALGNAILEGIVQGASSNGNAGKCGIVSKPVAPAANVCQPPMPPAVAGYR